MLLAFRVANYRSLRGEHELSFVATRADEGIARLTGARSGGQEIAVIPTIGVFGANASGKSNLLAAMRAMRAAVLGSVRQWTPGGGVPREPFVLDPACRDETTMFEMELLLGVPQVRYTYGFELSDDRVEAEWLHAYPNGHKQVWFDREAARSSGKDFRFPGDGLRGAKERLVEQTRHNSLFLTVGATFNNPQLAAVHRWFDDNLRLVTSDDDVTRRSAYTRNLLLDPVSGRRYRKRVEALLQVADLGIVGLELDSARSADQQVRLLHRTGGGAPVALDLATQESLGTHAWFAFLGPVLDVLHRGSLLLADELDSSLHPLLAAEVVRLFQDPDANPSGAQLLFTTHDATLLGMGMIGRPLGRDQVWIATKTATGDTELYPLTDASPRKEENLELGYLRGRYGGVPRVTAGELSREVAQLVAESV